MFEDNNDTEASQDTQLLGVPEHSRQLAEHWMQTPVVWLSTYPLAQVQVVPDRITPVLQAEH
jgi:hypothetical protein